MGHYRSVRMSDLYLTLVGAAEEVVRTTDPIYAEQARNDFAKYLRTTLHYSQLGGGRFNAPGEFGALYTASNEDTAWAELHARYFREGIDGLPAYMGLIRLLLTQGAFVDFGQEHACTAWQVNAVALRSESPSPEEQQVCWDLARRVRALADFLRSPSARGEGDNVPLFVDGRTDTELELELISVATQRDTPAHFRQAPTESWDD